MLAEPSTLRALDEPPAGRLTIQYAPVAETEITETPPRFTWIPALEDEAVYALSVVAEAGSERVYTDIEVNFFTPPEALPPGDYSWRYCVWADGVPASAWSQTRTFTIAPGLPETPLASRATRYDTVCASHPRLWLDKAKIAEFRTGLAQDPNHCGWADFMERSVMPWADKPPMAEPAPYPNDTRVAPIWRQTYIDCQELIYAIRHQAIAGQILPNADLTKNAKAWLLEAATWDPEGTTSRSYTDEWAFRVNLALAWAMTGSMTN